MPDRADTARINSGLELPVRGSERFGDGFRHDILHCVAFEDITVVEGVFFKDTLKSPDDLMLGDSYRFPTILETMKPPVVDRAVLPAGQVAAETHQAVLMSGTGTTIHARVVLTRRQGPLLEIIGPFQDGSVYVLIELEPLFPDLASPETRPARKA